MKKLLYISIPIVISALAFGVILISDSAIPGDMLYIVDRQIEKAQVGVSRISGKVSYARLNLDLAGERLNEIQSLTSIQKPANVFIFKANAQTADTTSSEVDSLISQLIADFKFNIQEVISILGDDGVNTSELAKEVAEKTSDFSSELLVILPKLEEEELEDLDEVSDDLDELDEDAVEDLLDDSDEDEDSERIAAEKVSKTLLKVVEKVASLVEKLDDHKDKMTQAEIKVVTDGIAAVNTKIESARTLLSAGDLDGAYALLKEAKDDVSKLRDLMDQEEESQEREEEQEQEQEQESEDDEKGENENENKNENDDDEEEDDKDDDKKGSSSGSSNSGSSSKSGSSEDDEDEQEDEQEDESDDDNSGSDESDDEDDDDEEDVEGVSTKLSNGLWINFIF